MPAPATPRQAAFLLAAVIVLWGANWPVMKVGLDSIPPLWFAAARVLLGSACLFALLAAIDRVRLPGRADLPVVVSVAVLQIGLFLGLVNLGLQFVDAGRASILAYTTPLWVVPIARVTLGERPRRVEGLALLLGLGGIAVLFSPQEFDFTDSRIVTGNAMLVAAAISWALCIVHIRHHKWQMTPLQLMPWQMLIGGAALAVGAVATEFCFGHPLVGASHCHHGVQWTRRVRVLFLGLCHRRARPAGDHDGPRIAGRTRGRRRVVGVDTGRIVVVHPGRRFVADHRSGRPAQSSEPAFNIVVAGVRCWLASRNWTNHSNVHDTVLSKQHRAERPSPGQCAGSSGPGLRLARLHGKRRVPGAQIA